MFWKQDFCFSLFYEKPTCPLFVCLVGAALLQHRHPLLKHEPSGAERLNWSHFVEPPRCRVIPLSAQEGTANSWPFKPGALQAAGWDSGDCRQICRSRTEDCSIHSWSSECMSSWWTATPESILKTGCLLWLEQQCKLSAPLHHTQLQLRACSNEGNVIVYFSVAGRMNNFWYFKSIY